MPAHAIARCEILHFGERARPTVKLPAMRLCTFAVSFRTEAEARLRNRWKKEMDLVSIYESFIAWIGDGTGASDALLHVHAGLAVLFISRVLTRRSLATPIPFLFVVAAEIGNEVMDRLSFGSWRAEDTLLDVLNTLFWPFCLMVGLRLRGVRESQSTLAAKER